MSTLQDISQQLDSCKRTLVICQQILEKELGVEMVEPERLFALPEINFGRIEKVVAQAFHITPAELRGSSQAHTYVLPRNICCWLARRLTQASLTEIGKRFHRHHTTVMYAIDQIETKRAADPNLASALDHLIKLI